MSDARDFFGYKRPDDEPGRREETAEDDPTAPPQFDEAITLDNARVISGIDSGDMIGRVRELPRQLALARRVAASVKLPTSHTDVDAVCVLAMGGSAIGADLVEGIAGERLRVPLAVHRDYGLPAWAGERTLVIAASHSGETVETVSGAGEARRRGLPLVVISTGGALGTAAAADGTPYRRY
jgi:glucose/mannose-6-phosphate isomerase